MVLVPRLNFAMIFVDLQQRQQQQQRLYLYSARNRMNKNKLKYKEYMAIRNIKQGEI